MFYAFGNLTSLEDVAAQNFFGLSWYSSPHAYYKAGFFFPNNNLILLKVPKSTMKPFRRVSEAVHTCIRVTGDQVHCFQAAKLYAFRNLTPLEDVAALHFLGLS
jgi:hypothetical protein